MAEELLYEEESEVEPEETAIVAGSLADDFVQGLDQDGSGHACFGELCGLISEVTGKSYADLVNQFGYDFNWVADPYFLTDYLSNHFDMNGDGLCAEELGGYLT